LKKKHNFRVVHHKTQTIQLVVNQALSNHIMSSTTTLLAPETLHSHSPPRLPFSPPHFVGFAPPRITLKPILTRKADLPERLLGDVAIGSAVTAVVSPFVTVIDKALVQRSAGTHTVVGSAILSVTSMLRNPVAYFKSPTFLWMWATYAATYSVANSIKTIMEHKEMKEAADSNRPIAKTDAPASSSLSNSASAVFVGTTFANSGACLMKDRAYAQLFGSASASATVPAVSYGLWILRDISVIGSSFILPDYVAPVVKESWNVSSTTAHHIAQVGTPMAAQLVASPLHFLGLDCYNRPLSHLTSTSSRWLERSRFLTSSFAEVSLARMIRVLPGYGIAGVWNKQLRDQWRSHMMQRQVKELLVQRSKPLIL
jgi:hypothetical protein